MAGKRIPKLLVVFDTNVLFTQVASDLIRSDAQRIIEENSNHVDLNISWYLPDVVVGERKYQMLGKAKELLPNMKKLEKLIGHQFGVGEDTLELHVDKAIKDGVDKNKLGRIGINQSKIDWNDLIERSTKRLPPFDAGENEKGFRDAIIAHSFLQLHQVSPTTPNICRLALVSEDQRLRDYVAELTGSASNIRILKGLDELESLINTLVSTVSEDFVGELSKKASKVFFEKENEKTLYYKEQIGEKIREQYSEELKKTPIPDGLRSNGTWWISEPIFIRKDRQTVYWVTPIEPEFEIFHYESETPNMNSLAGFAANFLATQAQAKTAAETAKSGLGLLGSGTPKKKVVDLKGREKFEAHWSATLSQAQNLTAPKLSKIVYAGNNLPESSS